MIQPALYRPLADLKKPGNFLNLHLIIIISQNNRPLLLGQLINAVLHDLNFFFPGNPFLCSPAFIRKPFKHPLLILRKQNIPFFSVHKFHSLPQSNSAEPGIYTVCIFQTAYIFIYGKIHFLHQILGFMFIPHCKLCPGIYKLICIHIKYMKGFLISRLQLFYSFSQFRFHAHPLFPPLFFSGLTRPALRPET